MFDMTNEEAIIQMIKDKDEDCYVIPLYVHINNNRYNLWEMDQINDFSPYFIKVGFGSSRGLMIKSQLPAECVYEFNMELTLHQYDYDKDVDRFYYVFETGFMEEEELKDDFHKQIQAYMDAIAEYVKKHVEERRMKVRKQMMEDEDNYISTE